VAIFIEKIVSMWVTPKAAVEQEKNFVQTSLPAFAVYSLKAKNAYRDHTQYSQPFSS
jgi:hypothetical protein